MNIILDTCFIYSLFNNHDVNFTAANEQFAATTDDKEFIIPTIVIAELLMADGKGETVLEACHEIVPAFTPITNNELKTITAFSYATRKQLKANDCIILAIATVYEAQLYTFDKKLMKMYKQMM